MSHDLSRLLELQERIARSLPPEAACGKANAGCQLTAFTEEFAVALIVNLDRDPSAGLVLGGTRALISFADGSVELVESAYRIEGELHNLPELEPTPI